MLMIVIAPIVLVVRSSNNRIDYSCYVVYRHALVLLYVLTISLQQLTFLEMRLART